MKIIRTIPEMREARQTMPGPVGFVPTMGYLHEGHLSLVQGSKQDNLSTVISIFVNPTQFGPKDDFNRYPRDERRDISMLEKAGVDVVFLPSAQDMYPSGFNTWVDLSGITERLEGAARPGHFRGVATVCNKLFNIVLPDKAYFGQKDAQQLAVIKKMVTDLNINLGIVAVPTLREADGLAMSSRNSYLVPKERTAAAVLYKSLCLAGKMIADGEHDAESVKRTMFELIETEPIAKIEYISVADTVSLQELENIRSQALISLAVRIGKTRLIDNIALS
jgi:pantoate--beta-alanine ligase